MQFFVFIALGSLADHGSHRKNFLLFFGYSTCILGLCLLLVTNNKLWYVAFAIYVLSNITFGASFVFYYAWVPILTRFDQSVLEVENSPDTAAYYKASDAIANQISSKGFGYGYFASFVELVAASAFAVYFGDGRKYGLTQTYGLQIGIAFAR